MVFNTASDNSLNAFKKIKGISDLDCLFDRLYPICRSITGSGARETLRILAEYMPLETIGIASGTEVLDWTIPQEWIIREAWIKDSAGNKIIDFNDHNLHVINYSAPLDAVLTLKELQSYIHTLPNQPDAIPYITSYYKRRQGFCMAYNQLCALPEDHYHAYIETEFIDGELSIGHCIIPGETDQEILISTYICHPSMANNELSGPLVATYLYNKISSWSSRRFTYRFVFIPETIGSISYLSLYGDHLKNKMHAGLVLTCLGGKNAEGIVPELSYKLSRRENSPLDQFCKHLQLHGSFNGSIRTFTPTGGSDERQYCSPGYNLPVGQMARSIYGEYAEYHTSLDDKTYMSIEALEKSADELEVLLKAFEIEGYYVNLRPYGEVKLDQHNLYPDMNSPLNRDHSTNRQVDGRTFLNQILMLLSYADGQHLLSEIAKKCDTDIFGLLPALEVLLEKKLIAGPYINKQELS